LNTHFDLPMSIRASAYSRGGDAGEFLARRKKGNERGMPAQIEGKMVA